MESSGTHAHALRAIAVVGTLILLAVPTLPPAKPLLPTQTLATDDATLLRSSFWEERRDATSPSIGALAGFTENVGQIRNSQVRYYSSSSPLATAFTDEGVLLMQTYADGPSLGFQVRIRFEGANRVSPVGAGLMAQRTAFFTGSEPSGWFTEVRSFHEVTYPQLYDGVDLTYRASKEGMKYEFYVHPGGNPELVAFFIEGALD